MLYSLFSVMFKLGLMLNSYRIYFTAKFSDLRAWRHKLIKALGRRSHADNVPGSCPK